MLRSLPTLPGLQASLPGLPGAVTSRNIPAAKRPVTLGVPPAAAAELLPVIEAVMVRKLNEELSANGGPDFVPYLTNQVGIGQTPKICIAGQERRTMRASGCEDGGVGRGEPVLAAGLPRSQRDLGVERDDDADLREGKHLIRPCPHRLRV
jgi:hypothetical protein